MLVCHQGHHHYDDGDKRAVSAHIKQETNHASSYNNVKREIGALLQPFCIYNATFELELADEPCRMNTKEA